MINLKRRARASARLATRQRARRTPSNFGVLASASRRFGANLGANLEVSLPSVARQARPRARAYARVAKGTDVPARR
ncbi:MAG: hypothetical protein ABJN76_03575, partial [Parasphingorhabdus sp.]|uniref:hypothetical protein n=1 Tax=Parasphingorhabdus sp. TaxID=2709688 RepID=UPI0032970436